MAWNLNFNEKTQLREWWKIVRDNFIHLMDKINTLDKDVDRRIIANSSVTPSRHIGQLSEQSEWLTSDVYLVATETDGVYDEYAFIDGAWMVVNKTDLEGYATDSELKELSAKVSMNANMISMLNNGQKNVVNLHCGTYTDPALADNTDGIKMAFIDLGFTPEWVQVTSQLGSCIDSDIDGTIIGGIVTQNKSLVLKDGEVGYYALQIVKNGFQVSAFTKGSVSADLITGTRFFTAYQRAKLKNIK